MGTNGDGGRKKGEEELKKGEMTLCMTSSLTTGLKGPRLASHKAPVPPDFTDTRPPSRPLRLSGTNVVRRKNGLGTLKKLWMIRGSIDRQMAVSCWWLFETSEEVKVSGEV